MEARGSAHRAQGMEPSTSGALEVRGLRLEEREEIVSSGHLAAGCRQNREHGGREKGGIRLR